MGHEVATSAVVWCMPGPQVYDGTFDTRRLWSVAVAPVQTVGRPGGSESGLQTLTALGVVGPTVVVHGHYAAGVENCCCLGGPCTVQGEALVVEDRGEAGCAREEEGGVHRGKAFGDLPDRTQ
jgi:hypothetical protein